MYNLNDSNLSGMDNFITYKLKVEQFMRQEDCDETFIKNSLTDDNIIFGIVNNLSPENYAWALMF